MLFPQLLPICIFVCNTEGFHVQKPPIPGPCSAYRAPSFTQVWHRAIVCTFRREVTGERPTCPACGLGGQWNRRGQGTDTMAAFLPGMQTCAGACFMCPSCLTP